MTLREYPTGGTPEEWAEQWTAGADTLPRTVQLDTPLTRIDPLNPNTISVFAAHDRQS